MPASFTIVNLKDIMRAFKKAGSGCSMSKQLAKSTSVVAGMTMISRIFGFTRDMVTAQFFGAGVAFDAFSIAFKIPNFMRRLFAEGSFSQAFVPVLANYQKNQSEAAIKSFLGAMMGTLGVVLLVVTVLGIVLAPWLVRVFAPGFATTGARYDLAVIMLRITFPYLMLISLAAFSGAILNTYSRFWVAAFTPVFLNICMIGATIWLAPQFHVPIIALAISVSIGGIVQLLFQFPFLKKINLLPCPRVDFKDPGVRNVLKLMVPALFGVSVSQINLLLDTLFASFLIVGSVSWLYYSDRLMEFPLGVFGVAISTVILPHLSRHHASNAARDFSLTLDWALRCILLLGFPATVGLIVISGPLLSTLFQHGKFDGHAVVMAQKSLRMFALGIVPFMVIKILAAGFYAKQNMRTPVMIGVIAMLANMLFNLALIWPLAHAGIALATSLAAFVNMGFLYYFLRQKHIYLPQAGWAYFSFRLVIANSILAVWLWLASGDLQWWLASQWWERLGHLTFLLLSAGIIYLAGLWIVGVRPRDLFMMQSEVVVE